MLVDAGADINAIDTLGATPLEIAARNAKPDVIKILLDNGADLTINRDGYSPLHAAATSGDVQTVKYLIENGINISQPDSNGLDYTPLHWAVQGNNIQVANWPGRRTGLSTMLISTSPKPNVS